MSEPIKFDLLPKRHYQDLVDNFGYQSPIEKAGFKPTKPKETGYWQRTLFPSVEATLEWAPESPRRVQMPGIKGEAGETTTNFSITIQGAEQKDARTYELMLREQLGSLFDIIPRNKPQEEKL